MENEHKNCVEQCLAKTLFKEVQKGSGSRAHFEKITILQEDCDKVAVCENGDKICTAYLDPSIKWHTGCALASNQVNIDEEIKRVRVGQQKQRKT